MVPSTDVFTTFGGDGVAIQAAINAAAADVTKPPVLYLRGGVWKIEAELTLPVGCRPLTIIGEPTDYMGVAGTILRADKKMRSVLAIFSPYHELVNLKFDANRNATQGRFIQGWTFGRQSWVVVTNAIADGDFLNNADGTINDCILSKQCFYVGNGITYVTSAIASQYTNGTRTTIAGTAATTAGDPVVRFTGAPDLTTLGIRRGDFLRLGAVKATSRYLQIDKVAPATITLQGAANNLPKTTVTGLPFAIGVGDGWHDTLFRDNNRNVFDDCVFRGSGGSGIVMCGLYGDTVRDGLADFNNFFGVVMGSCDNVALLDSASLQNVYMEENTADYFFGQVTNVTVANPNRNASIFSIIGSSPQGTIVRNGTVESIALGAPQNFLVEVRNQNGVLQSRIVADHWEGFASLQADRVSGASVNWTPVPVVSTTTGFANGVGIRSDGFLLLLNTPNGQDAGISGLAIVEFSNVTPALVASLSVDLATNVGGVTMVRPALRLSSQTGAPQEWRTTTITPNKSIGIRLQAYIR